MTDTVRLPHPHRRGDELEVDVRHVSGALAETLRQMSADWARLTTETPFRSSLSRRLLTIAERAQTTPLDQLADDLRDLATSAEIAHKRGRVAAWFTFVDDRGEVAA